MTEELKPPMTMIEFEQLLREFGNANFACGEQEDDEKDPYGPLIDRAHELGCLINNAYANLLALVATPPPAPPAAASVVVRAGLSVRQEPKYTVNASAIVNRASGEAIPDDEPVFIFRARDVHARESLEAYACVVLPGEHREAVERRIADFAAFSYAHPERMKEPDTAAQGKSNG